MFYECRLEKNSINFDIVYNLDLNLINNYKYIYKVQFRTYYFSYKYNKVFIESVKLNYF